MAQKYVYLVAFTSVSVDQHLLPTLTVEWKILRSSEMSGEHHAFGQTDGFFFGVRTVMGDMRASRFASNHVEELVLEAGDGSNCCRNGVSTSQGVSAQLGELLLVAMGSECSEVAIEVWSDPVAG